MVAKKADAGTIEIHTVKQGRIKLRMIGRTPLYFNSMSSKAMRDLLIGGGKKTAAEKKEIKHNPNRNSVRVCTPRKLVIPISASLRRALRAQWLRQHWKLLA